MPLSKLNHGHLAVAVVSVIALAIVGGLAWGFAQQLTLARQMRAEEARLEQAVATEQARNEALTAQLEYVKSDEYVEYYARCEARMSKPGEVIVVPLTEAAAESVSEAQPTPASESKAKPLWIELWELVFGAPENTAPSGE